jgi:hypothetical protein
MAGATGTHRELLRLMSQPAFVLADLFGSALLMMTKFLPEPWGNATAALGSALLSIGISLPVGLYYQLRASAESLDILNACNNSGIRGIFESRLEAGSDLSSALDAELSKTTHISMLGVALRAIFGPTDSLTVTPLMRSRLDNPQVKLKVLILNPNSDAAKRRDSLERGGTCIEDINYTLNNGIPAVINERIMNLNDFSAKDKISEHLSIDNTIVGELYDKCNIFIKTYDIDPITFIFKTDSALFSEQYHFGRIKDLRTANCIGQHVPVIQYIESAKAARFLSEHFKAIWEMANDETQRLIKLTLTKHQGFDQSKVSLQEIPESAEIKLRQMT